MAGDRCLQGKKWTKSNPSEIANTEKDTSSWQPFGKPLLNNTSACIGYPKNPSIISTILLPLKFTGWVSANDILHPPGTVYQKKVEKSNTSRIPFWNSEFEGGKGIYSRYYPCDRVTRLKTGRFTVLNTAQRLQKKNSKLQHKGEAPGSDTCAVWHRPGTGDSHRPLRQWHRLIANVLQITPPTTSVRLLHRINQANASLSTALCIAPHVQLFE